MDKNNTLTIEYNSVMDLHYSKEDGHRHLKVPVFYDSKDNSNDTVNFIVDTGAFMTVLTRKTWEQFGFDKKVALAMNVPLTGFTGHIIEGFLLEIPMLLGGKRLDAKVVVPNMHIPNSKNILGGL